MIIEERDQQYLTDPVLLQALTNHFGQFISEHKKGFMELVLGQRTKYLTLVLEDIYQSHNASAVIRTCECLGIQDIHIIESASTWSTNKQVLKGSHKWINMQRYRSKKSNNIEDCFKVLRAQGYKIVVTDPAPGGIPIEELTLETPVALVMGNELRGCSQFAIQNADERVRIPMAGFTESLNISVSAAICLNTILAKLRPSTYPWELSLQEKSMLRLQWYKKVVKRSDLLEREFLRSIE
jgi:tRNA (guanosine-2'-O-)-methyltransferase